MGNTVKEQMENLLIGIGNALRDVKGGKIMYSITDLNAYLLQRTGKSFDPTDTQGYDYKVQNRYLHANGTAYNYFFSIPGGLKDTYNRDLGAGLGLFGNSTDTTRGLRKGDLSCALKYDALNRPYFEITNNTTYTINLQFFDTYKYYTGGTYYCKDNTSTIFHPQESKSFYYTNTFDMGYTADQFHFFTNNTAVEPWPAQSFADEIKTIPPITNFEVIKSKIIEDFPIATTIIGDSSNNRWTALQLQFNNIQNCTAVAFTVSHSVGTYLFIGLYPSSLKLQKLYDGSYSNVNYSIGLFPNSTEQLYSCYAYNGSGYNNWSEMDGVRNKFIAASDFFSSSNLVKYVDYGV